MSANLSRERLSVPESLKNQLGEFRRRVWSTKLGESLTLPLAALLLAYLTLFACDRIWNTPQAVRWLIFVAAVAAWSAIPWALYRWVWLHRRLDQLARLMRLKEPNIGDQLLSVIELAESDDEQARSRTLCAAAISQVAEAARKRDLLAAAPRSRVGFWIGTTMALALAVGAFAALAPAAMHNAWLRLSAPWRDTPRYTFASIEPLPEEIVVPHGESTPLQVKLSESSSWHPSTARLELAGHPSIEVALSSSQYEFTLPPQTKEIAGRLSIGDYRQKIQLKPMMRPELISAVGRVRLPDYLQLPNELQHDVRGGTMNVVEGSQASITATASRPLVQAKVNRQNVEVRGATFQSDIFTVGSESQNIMMDWQDEYRLAGREPFELLIQPLPDEAPSIASQELPRQAVLLDSEQLNFSALAADDFGVQRVGMSWQSAEDGGPANRIKGSKLIVAGAPDRNSVAAPANFSAKALGIPAQPVEVRLWVEDYLPNRPRVYSPPHLFYILTADQHAIWIAEQLNKWHRASMEVRETEIQLHEANKRLRAMTAEEMADEEMRDQLRKQAAAEANNGRRLGSLAKQGENLLRKASRNPEIGVGHLERWAEMLQVINDISANRMPSVTDLLEQAAKESQLARAGESKPSKPSGPSVGQNRSANSGAPAKPPEEVVPSDKTLPSIADKESSMQPADPNAQPGEGPKKKFSGGKFGLPETTLAAGNRKGDQAAPEEQPEANDEEAVDRALFEQAELLAEFERISDEMNDLLANLEGSTIVKRLKAASREQLQFASRLTVQMHDVFGRTDAATTEAANEIGKLVDTEKAGSQKVSYIMDDMQGYFERRRMGQFKVVLDEMRKLAVVDSLREVAESLPKESGLSIAQAEFWADTLDRWAEDLVDVTKSGQCPGSKSSDALPPSLVLEVLQILEGEMNLRETTRAAEQARAAIDAQIHHVEANRLTETQKTLRERTDKVAKSISELPEGDQRFGKEIDLLNQVSMVMQDAQNILATDETGQTAQAAETEAIELLLKTKRGGGGGGGGGASPGGGGSGTTEEAALALLGVGLNQNEKREARDVTQATGENGRVLPEEFRAGLDEYFQRLEAGK